MAKKQQKNEAKNFIGTGTGLDGLMEKMGISEPFPQEVLDKCRTSTIHLGEMTGDTNIEDILNNCLIELNKVKDVQSKAGIIIYLLGTLPIDLQKVLISAQDSMIRSVLLHSALTNTDILSIVDDELSNFIKSDL